MFEYLKKYGWISLLIILILILGKEISIYSSSSNQIDLNQIESDTEEEEVATKNKIWVDVKGAVAKPGIYEVTEEEIVNDVILKAGGLKKDAYTDNINLSQKVIKQMVINIFTKEEFNKLKGKNNFDICYVNSYDISTCLDSAFSLIISDKEKEATVKIEESTITTNSSVSNEPTIVNINTASINILTTLPGIGPSKAQAIIDYRSTNGAFKSIEDITKVKGIGEATFAKIKKYLKV